MNSAPAASSTTIPIMGWISAGKPVTGQELPEGCVSVQLDSVRLPRPGMTTFALKVRGSSMTDAGIRDGDVVILEHREALHGQIVAALIDGESTLKRYIEEAGKAPYLRAENPRFPVIVPARELAIQGVVVALLRTYK